MISRGGDTVSKTMVLMFVAPILLALATPALAQTVAVLASSKSVFSGNPFSVDISISDVADPYALSTPPGLGRPAPTWAASRRPGCIRRRPALRVQQTVPVTATSVAH